MARGEQTETSDRHVGYIIAAVMAVVALGALTGVASVMNCQMAPALAPNTEPFPHAHDRLGGTLGWRLCDILGDASDESVQRSLEGRMEARGYTPVGQWGPRTPAGEVSPTGLEGACGVVVAFAGEFEQVRVVRNGDTETGCQARVASVGTCGTTPVMFVGTDIRTRSFLMIGLTDETPPERVEYMLAHAEAEMLLGGHYLGEPQIVFEPLASLDTFTAPAPSEGCLPYVVVTHGSSPILEWDGIVLSPPTGEEWDMVGVWSCEGSRRQTVLSMSAGGQVAFRALTQAPALSTPIGMPTVGAAAVVDREDLVMPRALVDLGAPED